LYLEAFDEDRDQVIERALSEGVNHFFMPSINSKYFNLMFQLEKQYSNKIHLMTGLHPCYVKDDFNEELAKVLDQLKLRKFCAIGEIGIDLYWDKSFLKQQQEAFQKQIEMAINYQLPVVIHCREAFDEIFEILDQYKSQNLYGIFHCFSGSIQQARKAIRQNFKLGIGGIITFKNGKIDQFIHKLPLESIVLETDSPYLSPSPFRGKRNESSYLTLVLEKLSECFKISNEKVASITTKNALEVFKNVEF
tara:strand:+ start:7159 stop:7908 length:750 start_codon:yes stop_codon:yes gene_type:complete